MIGWLLIGRAAGRRDERRRLDDQAERQRRRAPEPGVILPEAPRYAHTDEAASAWWFARWIVLPVLVILGMTISWTIYWIGIAATIIAVSVYGARPSRR